MPELEVRRELMTCLSKRPWRSARSIDAMELRQHPGASRPGRPKITAQEIVVHPASAAGPAQHGFDLRRPCHCTV